MTERDIVFTTKEAISERQRAFEQTDPRKSIVPHIEIATMWDTIQKKNIPIFKIHPGIESQYGAYEGSKKYILPALAIENKKLCLHHLVEELPLSKADSLNPYSISTGTEYDMLDKNKSTYRILYQDTKSEQINKIYDFYYNLLDGLIETSK